MIDIGNASETLLAALIATIEACGATWSDPTISLVLRDLARHPEGVIIDALERCRRELRFKLTLADIIDRIDDGRPAPDEAWAQVSAALDERRTVVATDEALEALREVRHLAGDDNAVRMGFRAAYQRIVLRNKAEGIAPQWVPSLGHDPEQREAALREAADKGRLDPKQVPRLLGAATDPLMLPAAEEEKEARRPLVLTSPEGQQKISDLLAQLGGGLRLERQRQAAREPKYDWKAEEQRLQDRQDTTGVRRAS